MTINHLRLFELYIINATNGNQVLPSVTNQNNQLPLCSPGAPRVNSTQLFLPNCRLKAAAHQQMLVSTAQISIYYQITTYKMPYDNNFRLA